MYLQKGAFAALNLLGRVKQFSPRSVSPNAGGGKEMDVKGEKS